MLNADAIFKRAKINQYYPYQVCGEVKARTAYEKYECSDVDENNVVY
jgi:hypothetical protein